MGIRRVRRYEVEIDKQLVDDLAAEGVVVTEHELEQVCESALRKGLEYAKLTRLQDRLVLTPDELRAQREQREKQQ
jgi:hypothetical protein